MNESITGEQSEGSLLIEKFTDLGLEVAKDLESHLAFASLNPT